MFLFRPCLKNFNVRRDERKLLARKARQAVQASEGKAAMAEYRKSAGDAIARMDQLRAQRLKREAQGRLDNTGREEE